jgi:predicted Rossmann-fold nucleotide-binding protein
LGQISTPIVVLNTNGYFNLFADLMQQAVSEKFMTDDGELVWKLVNEPEEVIPCIRTFKTQKIELTEAGTLR